MVQLRGPFTVSPPVRAEAPMALDSSWLEVDLTRLQRNFLALRTLVQTPTDDPSPQDSNSKTQRPVPPAHPLVCCVIKKDAYGLGASAVAHRLVKAGCDMLAVYSVQEAEYLIHQSVNCPILLLAPLRELGRTDALYRPAVAETLHLSIHDADQLQTVNQIGQTFGIKMPVHLYLDTGMSRSGLNAQQFTDVMGNLAKTPHVRIAGIYSHLATADDNPDFAYEQLEQLQATVAQQADLLPDNCMIHIANSFATLRDQRFHLDMVRPGLALYGFGPELLAPGPILQNAPVLEHTVRWVTRINHVQRYPRWTPVGYGCTHKLKRNSVLGVIPIGYGDGYPLALGNKASVRVFPDDQGTWFDAPVLGKVNMDQLTIDLTDAPTLSDDSDIRTLINATVHIISDDPAAPNSVPNLARIAQSHPYEILCRLSKDLPRKYTH
jgi:alanine racemase